MTHKNLAQTISSRGFLSKTWLLCCDHVIQQ